MVSPTVTVMPIIKMRSIGLPLLMLDRPSLANSYPECPCPVACSSDEHIHAMRFAVKRSPMAGKRQEQKPLSPRAGEAGLGSMSGPSPGVAANFSNAQLPGSAADRPRVSRRQTYPVAYVGR